MRATKFDKRITVKRPVTSRTNPGGIKASSYTTLFECWARLEPMAGQKRVDYMALGYSDPYNVYMRRRDDYEVNEKDIAVINSKEYQVLSKYNTEDERFTVLEIKR